MASSSSSAAIDPAPFGFDTVLTWDLAGNKRTEQNRRDFVTTYHYDDLDRLIRIDDPAAAGTFQSFTYDAVGNRLSSTDRRGIRTRFAWDRENRLLSTTRAGITLESNQYDGNGNRIFTTDARGHTTGFEYRTGFVSEQKTPHLRGNQCENCHGPASLHVAEPKNPKFSQPLRLKIDAFEYQCRKCHDTDNDPKFDLNAYWVKIKHPRD